MIVPRRPSRPAVGRVGQAGAGEGRVTASMSPANKHSRRWHLFGVGTVFLEDVSQRPYGVCPSD